MGNKQGKKPQFLAVDGSVLSIDVNKRSKSADVAAVPSANGSLMKKSRGGGEGNRKQNGTSNAPPRMRSSNNALRKESNSLSNDLNKSLLSDRANVRPSQIAAEHRKMSRSKISEEVSQKRSTSQNHLLPPTDELGSVLKSLRRKFQRRKDEKDKRMMMVDVNKSAAFISDYIAITNCQEVNAQLTAPSNLSINQAEYEQFQQIRSQAKIEIQHTSQQRGGGGGVDEISRSNIMQAAEQQYERSSRIIEAIERLRMSEADAMWDNKEVKQSQHNNQQSGFCSKKDSRIKGVDSAAVSYYPFDVRGYPYNPLQQYYVDQDKQSLQWPQEPYQNQISSQKFNSNRFTAKNESQHIQDQRISRRHSNHDSHQTIEEEKRGGFRQKEEIVLVVSPEQERRELQERGAGQTSSKYHQNLDVYYEETQNTNQGYIGDTTSNVKTSSRLQQVPKSPLRSPASPYSKMLAPTDQRPPLVKELSDDDQYQKQQQFDQVINDLSDEVSNENQQLSGGRHFSSRQQQKQVPQSNSPRSQRTKAASSALQLDTSSCASHTIRQEINAVLQEKFKRQMAATSSSSKPSTAHLYPAKTPVNAQNDVGIEYIKARKVSAIFEKDQYERKSPRAEPVLLRNVSLHKVKTTVGANHDGRMRQQQLVPHSASASHLLRKKSSKIILLNKQPLLNRQLNLLQASSPDFHDMSMIGDIGITARGGYYPTSEQQQQQQQNNSNYDNSFMSSMQEVAEQLDALPPLKWVYQHDCSKLASDEISSKKYKNVESHYSPNNIQMYLNKEYRSHSTNSKWLREAAKTEANVCDASKRGKMTRIGYLEVRSKTKENQIAVAIAGQQASKIQGMEQFKKSLALYATKIDQIERTTRGEQIDVTGKKFVHRNVDEQKGDAVEPTIRRVISQQYQPLSDRSYNVKASDDYATTTTTSPLTVIEQNKQVIKRQIQDFQEPRVFTTVSQSSGQNNNNHYQPDWMALNGRSDQGGITSTGANGEESNSFYLQYPQSVIRESDTTTIVGRIPAQPPKRYHNE